MKRTDPQMTTASIALRAGGLDMALQEGRLVDIRYAGVEVWRTVMFLYRDPAWATPRHAVTSRSIDVREDGFDLRLDGRCPAVPAIRWNTDMQGFADGRIRYSVEIEVGSDLLTSRTGLCVLHPASAAGTALEVEHVDGRVSRTSFPERIAPWQPFTQIRALRHRFAPGGWAICQFDGDDFEMEDQRNFSDASFKTYSRSNFMPRPFRLDGGAVLRQSVTLWLEQQPRRSRRTVADERMHVTVSNEKDGNVPAIRLLAPAQMLSPGAGVQRPSHWRIDLRGWSPATSQVPPLPMFSFGGTSVPSRLDLLLDNDAHVEVACKTLAAACQAQQLAVGELAIFPTSARAVDAARNCFPRARIGGGTPYFFTHLNRMVLPPRLDFVTYATCPIIHVADDASVMQSLSTLTTQVSTLRARGIRAPLHVGPIGIGMSLDPFGVDVRQEPGFPIAMASDDPRDHAVFGQAWMLGYLCQMAAAGVASVTLTHAGVFDALAALVARQGASIRKLRNPDPDRLAVLAVDDGKTCTMWFANLSAEPLEIALKLPWTTRRPSLRLAPHTWASPAFP
jgi:D-apionolactonase